MSEWTDEYQCIHCEDYDQRRDHWMRCLKHPAKAEIERLRTLGDALADALERWRDWTPQDPAPFPGAMTALAAWREATAAVAAEQELAEIKDYQMYVEDVEKELAEAHAREAALVEALKQARPEKWRRDAYGHERCNWCETYNGDPHYPDCPQVLLADISPAAKALLERVARGEAAMKVLREIEEDSLERLKAGHAAIDVLAHVRAAAVFFLAELEEKG